MNENEVDYEQALISSLIVDAREVENVACEVSEKDFQSPIYRKVFLALVVMQDAGDPMGDVALLCRRLVPLGLQVKDVVELFGKGVAANAVYYAKIVREEGRRRRLQLGLAKILDDAAGSTSEETLRRMQEVIQDCESNTTMQMFSISEAGAELLEDIESNEELKPSCFSGIASLDSIMGGFCPGEVVVIAARPGVGKSSLMMQFALQNAQKSRAGLVVSLEMTKRELAGRLFCGLAEVDSKHLRNRSLTKDEMQKIRDKVEELHSLKLFIWDPSKASIEEIQAMARLANLRHDIQFLSVDYIGLIDGESDTRQRISNVTKKIKQLAKEIGVPVFALCQLNREADGKEPTLAMLRDSGSVEQDADVVIFLNPAGEQDVDLIIAKNRHGATGVVKLKFDGAATRFNDDSAPVQWS